MSCKTFIALRKFPERGIPDLKVYLSKLGYDLQFAPGFVRYGVTYGELTAFKKSRLKLLEAEAILLGGKGEKAAVFTHQGLKLFRMDKAEIDKSALLTRFQYQDRHFALVNTHLSTDLYNTRKLKQLFVIRALVSEDKEAIILGDFNYAAGRRKLTKAMESEGFKSGIQNRSTFRFAPGMLGRTIIFFSEDAKLKRSLLNACRTPTTTRYFSN